jgi:hypothetical protein
MRTTRTGSISESGVVFFSAGGHNHDGVSSSLIDTSKYSIFDFNFGLVSNNRDRLNKQNINQNGLRNFIVKTVNESVLEPAGIVLQDNIINSRNIIAGSITADEIAANTITGNNIAANTITGNNIAAGTITADLIDANALIVSSITLDNGDYWNDDNGFQLGGANGIVYSGNTITIGTNVTINAELAADSITVGSGGSILEIDDDLQSGTKAGLEIGGGTYNYWYTDGTFRVGGIYSFMEWDGTTFRIRGGFDSGQQDDRLELEGIVLQTRPFDDPSFSTYGAVVLAPAEYSSTAGNDAIRFYYGSNSETADNTASIRALDGGDLRVSGSAASQSISFSSVSNGVSFGGPVYATSYSNTSVNEGAYFRNISYGNATVKNNLIPIIGDIHFS